MSNGVGIFERAGAVMREHSPSMLRDIDLYLSENMYDLVDKHSLATRNDLVDVDKNCSDLESRVSDLKLWKEDFSSRMKAAEGRISLLEKKYAIKR